MNLEHLYAIFYTAVLVLIATCITSISHADDKHKFYYGDSVRVIKEKTPSCDEFQYTCNRIGTIVKAYGDDYVVKYNVAGVESFERTYSADELILNLRADYH